MPIHKVLHASDAGRHWGAILGLTLVGHVKEIVRFPVKSMAGQTLASAEIGWRGIEGDRQFAFVRRGNSTRFPWFTGRNLSELVLYSAAYDVPDAPRTSPVFVEAPGGTKHLVWDPELRKELELASGVELDLLQLGVGAHDSMPLSLITTAGLDQVEARHGCSIDRRRYRTNLVIESPSAESEWQGCRMVFGDRLTGPQLMLARPAPRCAMVTIDPLTAKRDPSVLRTIAQDFGNVLAMYASVARTGRVQVGDPVCISDV